MVCRFHVSNKGKHLIYVLKELYSKYSIRRYTKVISIICENKIVVRTDINIKTKILTINLNV